MNSDYRYVVFSPNKQPTVREVAELQAWSRKSKHRYAVGINGDDGGLAIAFESRAFETARSSNTPLTKLIQRWEVRGCQVLERLPFIKKPTALNPLPGGLLHEAIERRSEPTLKRKQLAAQEALGRAGIEFYQTLQQHVWLSRIAKTVPYVLMGLGALLTIVAGIVLSQRLKDSPAERRQQTIQRVADDAMDEPLTRQSENNGEFILDLPNSE